MSRSYSKLVQLESFEDRFNYLSLLGYVGEATFGSERFANQAFYNSYEWRSTRSLVISRDSGCDLGVLGREIHSNIHVHHINPISPKDLKVNSDLLFDMDNLISTSQRTHNAIHYGNSSNLILDPVERFPGDTIDW